MADVFGAAVAAVQLTSYCFYILGVTQKLKRSTAVLQRHQQLLHDLANLAQEISKNPLLQTQEIAAQTLSILCAIRQTNIPQLLRKGRLSRALTFLLQNQELTEVFTALERSKATLSLSIQHVQSQALHEIRGDVRAMANRYRRTGSPADSGIGDCSTTDGEDIYPLDKNYPEKTPRHCSSFSFTHQNELLPYPSGPFAVNSSTGRFNPFENLRTTTKTGPRKTFPAFPTPPPPPPTLALAPRRAPKRGAAPASRRRDTLDRLLLSAERDCGGSCGGSSHGSGPGSTAGSTRSAGSSTRTTSSVSSGGRGGGGAVFRNNVSRGAGDMVLGVVIEGASRRQLARLAARAPLDDDARGGTWVGNTKAGPGPQILGVDVVIRDDDDDDDDDEDDSDDDALGRGGGSAALCVPAFPGTWEDNVVESLVESDGEGHGEAGPPARAAYSQILGARVRFGRM